VPHTVFDRYKLFPGASFPGPAIIEERESTVVIGEDAKVTVDEQGFLWIDLPHQTRKEDGHGHV
jgi:N-methylhydantoinase A